MGSKRRCGCSGPWTLVSVPATVCPRNFGSMVMKPYFVKNRSRHRYHHAKFSSVCDFPRVVSSEVGSVCASLVAHPRPMCCLGQGRCLSRPGRRHRPFLRDCLPISGSTSRRDLCRQSCPPCCALSRTCSSRPHIRRALRAW